MQEMRKKYISFMAQDSTLLYSHLDESDMDNKIRYLSFSKKLKVNNIDLTKVSTNFESALSGGEKQKVAIVNTLLKMSELIIMDEPTSAMDKESIQALVDILLELKKGRIIIVVTHSKELINIADLVITL